MAHTPPGRRDPDERRRQIRRAARNGFLWFTGLWLVFRNGFRRLRRWSANKVKALAENRPVALGAAGGIALMTIGLIAYAALSDEGYSPRLMPLPPATTSARSALPPPTAQPPPSPEPPTVLPTPPPPSTPTPPSPPVSPINPPLPLPPPAEPSIPPPFEPTTQPSPTSAPTPSPTAAPSSTPTQTCIFTPDGERCQNPGGLVKNSKTPPGQTRAPH